jgi:hypothetical protein
MLRHLPSGARSVSPTSLVATLALLAACGGSSTPSHAPGFDAGATAEASTGHDAPESVTEDGAVDAPPRSDATSPGDAAVMRNAQCTPTHQETGTAVDSAHGRLDGTLVYVVSVGADQQCNGDGSHVHLQIEVSGSVYDVAVDIGTAPNDEVGSYMETMAVPGGAWAEGWHSTDALGYPSLGLHSTSFTTADPTTIAMQLESLLASTTKISVFCTGYSQGNGCHDVHYENGSTKDGAIVLNPTAAMSEVLFFRFTSQSF